MTLPCCPNCGYELTVKDLENMNQEILNKMQDMIEKLGGGRT